MCISTLLHFFSVPLPFLSNFNFFLFLKPNFFLKKKTTTKKNILPCEIWRVYVFVWMRLRVFTDNHPSPSIFAVCLICFSVYVCVCVCVYFFYRVWLKGRERGRDMKKMCFFFYLPIWISLYHPCPLNFLVVRWFVRVIVCVCVDLNRRCIHIKQETTGFFLSLSLLSIRSLN